MKYFRLSISFGLGFTLFLISGIGIEAMNGMSGNMNLQDQTQSVTVLYPNGGELWARSHTYTIRWSSQGIEENVKILLLPQMSTQPEIMLTNSTPNTGSFTYTVAGHLSGQFKACIMTLDGRVKDESDALFAISISPVIDRPEPNLVQYPNGGETWQQGETYTIRWSFPSIEGSVKIVLSRALDFTDITLTNSTPNTGSFNYTVPITLGPSPLYKIQIKTPNGALIDESDNIFAIIESEWIKVNYPNGGESWELMKTYKISWTAPFVKQNVKISLVPAGATQPEIVLTDSTPNPVPYPGSFDFKYTFEMSRKIKNLNLGTNQFKIRIMTIDGKVKDESDAPFTIRYQVI